MSTQQSEHKDFNVEISDSQKWEEINEQTAIKTDLPASIVKDMRVEEKAGLYPLSLIGLKLKNFGCHEDIEIDFTSDNAPSMMSCLMGPNGYGKTTILHAITALFNDYRSYEKKRYEAKLLSSVRNWQDMGPSEIEKADCMIAGHFHDGKQEYEVVITRKEGFSQHPAHILENLPDYCFFARFDQELNTFQVKRSLWPKFKGLFESVTGYEVEEDVSIFDEESSDPRARSLVSEYVLSFIVKKPREAIKQRQCSAGERKIAKCFSTILNRPNIPKIILIDNITDHVENSRHIPVMHGVEQCFDSSQNIVTCHSVPVQKNLQDRSKIIDLRFLYFGGMMKSQQWRVRILDEVCDLRDKLIGSYHPGTENQEFVAKTINFAENMCERLIDDPDMTQRVASDMLSGMAAACYRIIAHNYTREVGCRIASHAG